MTKSGSGHCKLLLRCPTNDDLCGLCNISLEVKHEPSKNVHILLCIYEYYSHWYYCVAVLVGRSRVLPVAYVKYGP